MNEHDTKVQLKYRQLKNIQQRISYVKQQSNKTNIQQKDRY